MKYAILICGFLRSFELNLENFIKNVIYDNDIDIFIHKTKDEFKDKYKNKSNWEKIKKRINFKYILESDDVHLSMNKKKNDIINQFYKFYLLNNIKNIIQIQENIKYDIVIKWRPDIFINNRINFNDINGSYIYIPKDTKIDLEKLENINDDYLCDIIAYGSNNIMNKYFNIYLYIKELINDYGQCQESLLYKYLCKYNINYKVIDLSYNIILSCCSIISISGNSSSGKSKLSQFLKNKFVDSFILECDRYHKWDRNDMNWKEFTHLNPEANYLTKMKNDVFDLKIGNNIFQIDYDHTNGKFTDKKIIESKKNIFVCGLHTLYEKYNFSNLSIFMDTMYELNKYWKIKRDTKYRGYSLDKINEQIDKRKEDYKKFIVPQKKNADIIINFYTDDTINFDILDKNIDIKLRVFIRQKFNVDLVIHRLSNINFKYKILNEMKILDFSLYNDYYNIIFTIINYLKF